MTGDLSINAHICSKCKYKYVIKLNESVFVVVYTSVLDVDMVWLLKMETFDRKNGAYGHIRKTSIKKFPCISQDVIMQFLNVHVSMNKLMYVK